MQASTLSLIRGLWIRLQIWDNWCVLGLYKAWLIWPVCTQTYLGCDGDSKDWLLPLQDGNLSAHLTTMWSVVIRHLLILHDISFLYGIYLTLHKVFLIKNSVVDPCQFGTDPYLWLSDPNSDRIGIGSKSGFRSYYYSQWPSERQPKIFFRFFKLLHFEATIKSFFKDKKS